MASQWGRDSSFQTGGKRRSGVPTAIAVIFALALGAVGGYAALRFVQPESSAALDGARAQIAELNDDLASARKDLDAALAAQASNATQVDELKAKIAAQAGELDAMAENLAASTSQARTTENTPAADDDISRERERLAAENQTLKADLAALEAERDALDKSASAEKQRLEAELARLQNEIVPQLTAERDQLQRKTTMMQTDQATLKARIKAAADANASDAEVIADLQARLAEAQRNLTASQAELAAIEVQKTGTAASEKAADAADGQLSEAAAGAGTRENAAPSRRNPDAVAAALRAAPGLETLSDDDRRKLTDTLVAGECVTSALESVFERIPILALRNLIRDLNSGC